MIHILGNGLTSLIIAACLDFLKKDFRIEAKSINTYLPSVLYLKYDNEDELKLFFKIFKIDYTKDNIDFYTKEVKIGFFYDFNIHDTCSKLAKVQYLYKQNRVSNNSSMSDGLSSFYAIDLKKLYNELKQRYTLYIVNEYSTNVDKVYDTIDYDESIIPNKVSYEYVLEYDNQLKDYDYVYDCSLSNVKRYSKNTIELLSPAIFDSYCLANCYRIANYYDEAKVIKVDNVIKIGRNATKTQTKQKDVIYFVLKEENYEV